MRSVTRLAGCLLAVLLTAGAFGAPAGAAIPRDSVPVTGEVDGLYPGATVELVATVTNRYPFEILVKSIDATPSNAGACPASMLTVTESTAEVVVAPGASAGVPLQVHLDHSASDVCQGATFTVAFSGTVVEALPGATNGLAFTGGSIEAPLLGGTALLALGVVAIRRARRATA